MIKRALFLITWLLLLNSFAFALSESAVRGFDFLKAAQNPGGSWSSTLFQDDFPVTIAVLEAMKSAGMSEGTPEFDLAAVWLQGRSIGSTEYIAERLHLFPTSGDADALISYFDQYDLGWGGFDDYEVNNLDTALALRALKDIGYSDTGKINGAISYLLGSQNSDGGWGFYAGDGSNVYMTALISDSLQQFTQNPTLAETIKKAAAYMISHQNPDGGFGTEASTVYETSLCYIALVRAISDNTVLGNAVNYLLSAQAADGSWSEDSYETALAVRALFLSENRPAPLPVPTTGTVTGTVVNASGNQPLQGVPVVLQSDPAINTTTDASGYFSLTDVPQGNQTVAFTYSGFTPASVSIDMVAGSIIDVGRIALAPSPTTGSLTGKVTDAGTGEPIPGVTIAVAGAFSGSTTSDAGGAFILTDIAPGNISITVSKTGYYPVTATATVSAGSVLQFNPKLSTEPPSRTTGDLIGRIEDGSTKSPVQGATITISGGASSGTDAQGTFLLKDLTPGTYEVSVTSAGYASLNYSVLITEGVVTDMQTIYLTPIAQTTTVGGTVVDAFTGEPIEGAEVTIAGTNLFSKTDSKGEYSISGIGSLEFYLRASAIGYDSLVFNFSSTAYGAYTVNFPLNPSRTSELKITSLATDRGNYSAYSAVSIMAEVINSGSNPTSGSLTATIEDAAGQIVDNLQAMVPGEDGILKTRFDLQPGVPMDISIPWEARNHPPGTYRVTLKLTEGETGISFGTVVAAERACSFVIDPTQSVESLILTPMPRFTNLGAEEQTGIQASVVNRSNVASDLAFDYEWLSPGGVVVHSGSGTISLLPAEETKSILLETFPFTFTESGEYPVQITVVSGPVPDTLTGESVSVAPGTRIDPSQSLMPSTVVPDGDKEMRINIHLKGVVQQ